MGEFNIRQHIAELQQLKHKRKWSDADRLLAVTACAQAMQFERFIGDQAPNAQALLHLLDSEGWGGLDFEDVREQTGDYIDTVLVPLLLKLESGEAMLCDDCAPGGGMSYWLDLLLWAFVGAVAVAAGWKVYGYQKKLMGG